MTEYPTYLGQKGYSIYKESLTIHEQQYIRDALMVRPYLPKAPTQPDPFPIYQESSKKLYVPRYFGIENYGEPDEVRILPGKNINVNFIGTLREHQKTVVDIYMNHVNKPNRGGGLLEIPCGEGKTVIALNIIALLKTKTLVIVHKGFLLTQWIERIQQFLPDARVGRIQGQIIDMEDKDIVIGMLQSLSMKDYPHDLFKDFGLTITDEVHHISSEVFSRSLQKIVTNYSLGLSATMQRKDGLTKVFKMYLGPIIYKMKRKCEDNVLVKAIEFHTTDEEFNKLEIDWRGNPKYSTMISKLCKYNSRSEYIIKILQNELAKNSKQQIMVLAHNKELLVYLYKGIEYRNIATVGYYIGGMKPHDLKSSETKQIIIATYAMAAEGLDIKTLSTLVLATPKTDIIQAVGRILRVKRAQPLIIDIIDSHKIFNNQWKKRRAYYTKNKYTIIHTKNYEEDNWTTLYDPDIKVCKANKIDKTDNFPGKCLITIS